MTLSELLVSTAIVATLAALGLPAMRDFVYQRKLDAVSSTWLHFLYLARTEAIMRNKSTVICKSADGMSCARLGGWQQGWILFVDSNANARVDDGEPILYVQRALGDEVVMTGNTGVDSYISYSPMGSAMQVTGAFQAGSITLCSPASNAVRTTQLVLSKAGRWRTASVYGAVCK